MTVPVPSTLAPAPLLINDSSFIENNHPHLLLPHGGTGMMTKDN